MNVNTKKIAFLVGDGFEDSEFQKPYDFLRENGFTIEILGVKAGATVKGYKKSTRVKVELAAADADVDDYIALVIPGGQSPDHLRVDPKVVEFVARFESTGRPLA